MIALLGFRPNRIASKGDLVGFDHLALAEQFERPLLFHHHNFIDSQRAWRSRLRRHQDGEEGDRQPGKDSDKHVRIIAGAQAQECYAGIVNRPLAKSPFSRTALLFVAGTFFISLPRASAATWTVRAQPTRLVNGGPVLFQVRPPAKLESLTGTWLTHQLSFSYDTSTRTWFSLAGVSFETTPGRYPLELTAELAGSKAPLTITRSFTVVRAKYPQVKLALTVEKRFTEPSPEQQEQIAEGVKIKQDYLSRVTPVREWDGKFAASADAAISDVFGSQRIFNGKAQRPHFGLDYRVPTGTPVAAMNKGTVLLARFLYYEGNCVVIDHGQGLLTLYFHLSEFKVKEGDQVKRGQVIGLSGGTGRATGPHLHVAVRWQGTYLDPASLMRLRLP